MAGFMKSERDIARWEATRKSGRKAYIIKFGIFGWGVPVALAVTGMDWYYGTPLNELAVLLAIRLVLFGLVGGVAFGAVMWKFSERLYAQAEAAKPQA